MTNADAVAILFFLLLLAIGGLLAGINQVLLWRRTEAIQRGLAELRRKLDDHLPHECWRPEEAHR